MNDNETKQVAKGDNNTQIATQNIYQGLSPEEACKLAFDLFTKNFPKLEELAKKLVIERVNELWEETLKQCAKEQVTDFSAFGDPDMQLCLIEAQKTYARFGTSEAKENLSKLITYRIKQNSSSTCMKVIIDKAIELAGLLTSSQINLLSLTFITKSVVFNFNSLGNVKSLLDKMNVSFSNVTVNDTSYLLMLGCLKIGLGSANEIFVENHPILKESNFDFPKIFNEVPGDYTTSPVGTFLAIVNAESKLGMKFDPKIWINY